MITTNEIRKTWLEFFAKNGHTVVNSSPLVPHNDPTLMFTNAGMVQFKNIFTGQEKRDYIRATTAQKCVRAGGKHNDLDNVGYTCRHHTFFEMMGNFSFGDYFKAQAIEFAWNMVTKELGINKDKLCMTVFAEDDEAWNLWKKISGFADERIIRIPTKDNFWAMGDTGPCGPCSEIFYDHGEHVFGGMPGTKDQDGDRFVEIWNLVFMQYEQLENGERINLPKPSIDTGAGLERLAAVLQGTHDNYETDCLKDLILTTADELGIKDIYGKDKASLRVVADHLRASCFLIADGVMPSNEGRGYVLRRIMRRAMRHAHMMGAKEPLMYKLVPALNALMAETYPELLRAQSLIEETLKLEETRFKQTLERGIKLLDSETSELKEGEKFSGDVAFKLYDTYGFPLDLTQDALRNKGIEVDVEGFNAAMDKQRAEAKKSWAGSGEAKTDKIWFELREKVGATDFLGYTTDGAEGQILAIVKEGKEVSAAKEGEQVMLILNQTPFYGESGGQCGDTGIIKNADFAMKVTDTLKKCGDLFVHVGEVVKGSVKVGDAAVLDIDAERRANIRAHHSVTHLLQAALREVLGEHVTQKGSLVNDKYLRFDFSHTKALSQKELLAVEDIVNKNILLNMPVTTKIMAPEDAVKIGAMALFGEKYGDEVRVLTMGKSDDDFVSRELCGGTHVAATGDIGSFKIVYETAVAAGVRRIEAVAGMSAVKFYREQGDILAKVAEKAKSAIPDLAQRVEALVDSKKAMEKELADMRKKLATGGGAGASCDDFKKLGDIAFMGKIVEGVPANELKPLVDTLKRKIVSGVVAVLAKNDGKLSIVVGVTNDLTAKVDAVALVKAAAEAAGGKGGGGRADMAQAGSPDEARAGDALVMIEKMLGA